MLSTEDEQQRLAALGRYRVLDTPAEPEFDRITALAARLFRVPTVAIVLVDAERTFSKSRYGLALAPVTRGLAFSSLAIAGHDVLVVPDLAGDGRFAAHPLVTREPGVRFYAAAPICTRDGHALGCLELIDYRPRQLSSAEREMLANLAAVVMDGFELRATMAERERLEAAVRDREAHVVQSDRLASLGTLAAGVAHEINNPLTYVVTNLGFVSERLGALGEGLRRPDGKPLGPELADIREALAEAQEGAQRVRQIVRDLRTYSRGDDEKEKVIDVWRVLDWSANMAMNEIRHRARLVRDLQPVPGVRGTETRLGQVFINLLVNAAQAIAAGNRADHEIRISTMTDADGRAVICVSDTGPGIEPEVLDHVFEPFFTTKPTGVGLGLGLFVCHGIIKSMGGTLTAESPPGAGATFVVTLPPALPVIVPAADAAEPSTPSARRARVLAVDDEPQVLRSLQRALGAHEVIVADSGSDALRRLEADPAFDVILCDLMMDDMTGMDLHRRLSARTPELAQRIVFMTGGVFTDAARDFLAGVPNACIEKPFDLKALRALVALRAPLPERSASAGA
jgi:signal transduction histidine kinase/CheY-like chemotaxis protein